MKAIIRIFTISVVCLFMAACSGTKKVNPESTAYRPDKAELYNIIVRYDTLFFQRTIPATSTLPNTLPSIQTILNFIMTRAV
jgi:hypothetical protein